MFHLIIVLNVKSVIVIYSKKLFIMINYQVSEQLYSDCHDINNLKLLYIVLAENLRIKYSHKRSFEFDIGPTGTKIILVFSLLLSAGTGTQVL